MYFKEYVQGVFKLRGGNDTRDFLGENKLI